MEWTTTASLGVRAAATGYAHRHTIQQWWTKAKAYVDMGATQILVTGHAAVGKTLLASQMHGRARELGFKVPDESTAVEVEAITPGDWSKLVRVLPGQAGHRTQGEIDNLFYNSKLEGVIHVVDFGYTLPRDQAVTQALIEYDEIDTIEKLRERNLKLEVETLQTLLVDIKRLIATCGAPKWLLITVNKVDLFHKSMDQALLHYHVNGKSAFSKALREFQGLVGSSNLAIYVAPTCAYETDFVWNGDTVKSGLELRAQDQFLLEFINLVATISEVHS